MSGCVFFLNRNFPKMSMLVNEQLGKSAEKPHYLDQTHQSVKIEIFGRSVAR